MKIKNLTALLVAAIMAISLVIYPTGVYAKGKDKIIISVGSSYMYVNGTKKQIDPGGNTSPVNTGGNIFAPVKALVEEMGGSYSWSQKDKRLDIKLGKKTVQMWTDKKYSIVNGKKINLNTPPKIVKGKLLVPVKFLVEQLGASIVWDKKTNKITITFDKPSSDWKYLVINDFDINKENVIVKEKSGETYLFINLDVFKYAFKYPYLDNSNYPSVYRKDNAITATWSDSTRGALEIIMEVDKPTIIANGQPIDAGMGPFKDGDKYFIPINAFISILGMDIKMNDDTKSLLVQFKEQFPLDILAGKWSDVDTDLFTEYVDLSSGAKSLASFATGYMFNKDGTYSLIMVSVGGYGDGLLQQKGKYKILGNTIMRYDISETSYKGTPFRLQYKNKLLDKPEYDFIEDYNPQENKIEIGGFWLKKK